MNSASYIFGDSFVFIFLHIVLILTLAYSIFGEKRMKQDMASVKRSDKSWNYFYLAYGILSIVITQIISISECGKGYKVLITVIDLGILMYLSFFNNWFRNKTIGFIVASKMKEE